MLVNFVVEIRVGLKRCTAKTRSLSNKLLVSLPHVLREHERLVIETWRHHLAANFADIAHEVGIDAGPAIDCA